MFTIISQMTCKEIRVSNIYNTENYFILTVTIFTPELYYFLSRNFYKSYRTFIILFPSFYCELMKRKIRNKIAKWLKRMKFHALTRYTKETHHQNTQKCGTFHETHSAKDPTPSNSAPGALFTIPIRCQPLHIPAISASPHPSPPTPEEKKEKNSKEESKRDEEKNWGRCHWKERKKYLSFFAWVHWDVVWFFLK